jgi:Tol biopolymer transport system component
MKLRIFLICTIFTLFLVGCGNVGVQIQVLPTAKTTATVQDIEPSKTPTQSAVDIPSPTQTPIGGATALLFSSNRSGDYQDLYLQEIGSGEITRLTQGDSNTFAGPFSPNGKKIVFTGFGLTNSYVGVMNADGSDPVNISNQDKWSDGFPAWSPDGSQIAFYSRRDGNNEIYVMDPYGYQIKRLTNNLSDEFAPTWSPDGKHIAFLSDRDNVVGIYSIYIMNADGSGVKRLTNDKGNDYTPAWSPDGSRIAFRSVQKGQSDIYSVNIDGSGMVNLTNNPAEDWSPTWSPDGTMIAFQSDRDGNWEIYYMKSNGGDPVNLTNSPANDEMPYWRATTRTTASEVGLGKLAFVSFMDGDLALYTINTDGTLLTRLTSETMLIMNPTWSPNGNKIVFEGCLGGSMSSDCPAGVSFDIFVINSDGSEMTNITNDAFADRYPSWSPSEKIAFSSDRSGKEEIYTMNADGSGLTMITNSPTSNSEPHWSADGKWLAYHCTQASSTGISTQICIQPADGSGQAINIDGTAPIWSPKTTAGDQLLAFLCWSGSHSDICIARRDGSDRINLTNSPVDEISASWSPDGRWIAFQSNQYNDISLYKVCVDCESNSTPIRLTGGESNAGNPAWSPDGTWIAYLSDGDLSIMRTDGSGQKILAGNILGSPIWQP